jgi:hypothetical protein
MPYVLSRSSIEICFVVEDERLLRLRGRVLRQGLMALSVTPLLNGLLRLKKELLRVEAVLGEVVVCSIADALNGRPNVFRRPTAGQDKDGNLWIVFSDLTQTLLPLKAAVRKRQIKQDGVQDAVVVLEEIKSLFYTFCSQKSAFVFLSGGFER